MSALALIIATAGLTVLAVLVRVLVIPRRIAQRYDDSVKAFARAIELRHPAQDGMTQRLVTLCFEVGKAMRLGGKELEQLKLAVKLRDVGLCAVPYKVLNKDRLLWNYEEQAAWDRHCDVGAAILERVPTFRHLSLIVRYHHAPYDGSAGPHLPSYEDIPVLSRVIHVVESFVWCERAQGVLMARTMLDSGRGTLFDPNVVDKLQSVIRSSRAESRDQVASGVR